MTKTCTKCRLDKPVEEFPALKPGKLRAYCKECYCERMRIWRGKNPEKHRECNRKWQAKNPEGALRWRRLNPDKYRNSIRRWWSKKGEKQDLNRIAGNLRVRVRIALKEIPKVSRTLDLIGCSIVGLRTYLQSKFKSGMSWENYGQWHIDHIRPCSSFDLRTKEQQKQCFHFSNLQPLWAMENFLKGDKR
jgi:hypothetical protein